MVIRDNLHCYRLMIDGVVSGIEIDDGKNVNVHPRWTQHSPTGWVAVWVAGVGGRNHSARARAAGLNKGKVSTPVFC